MFPLPLARVLVYLLPVLIVAFSVVMGGYALAQGLGDAAGARGLLWAGLTLLLALVADVLLIVLHLGLAAASERPPRDDE